MQINYELMAVLGFISICTNVVLFVAFLMRKKTPVQRHETIDARRILHDLTDGSTILKIERIDPKSIWLRSANETQV